MKEPELSQFNQAIALAQAGHKQDAYDLFSSLRQHYPQDLNLLLWLAFTTPDGLSL